MNSQEMMTLSDDVLRERIGKHCHEIGVRQSQLQKAEEMEGLRVEEYKRRVLATLTPQQIEYYTPLGLFEDSEDSEIWWMETFLMPFLKKPSETSAKRN
jgi:hypothetical protein